MQTHYWVLPNTRGIYLGIFLHSNLGISDKVDKVIKTFF